jgi:hypothetical protein
VEFIDEVKVYRSCCCCVTGEGTHWNGLSPKKFSKLSSVRVEHPLDSIKGDARGFWNADQRSLSCALSSRFSNMANMAGCPRIATCKAATSTGSASGEEEDEAPDELDDEVSSQVCSGFKMSSSADL